MTAPLVFVRDLDGLELDEGDSHHLARVLRLRPGEMVTAADGAGNWRPCAVAMVSGGQLTLEAVGDTCHESRASPSITIGFALAKGGRPEWIVQKLTELGVDVIVPFVAARSVVRWEGDKAARNADRLRVVAREAAMQSRRAWLPTVRDVASFADVLAESPESALADRDGSAPSLATASVLVGPEGGWDDAELAAGRSRVELSEGVLRVETAAIAAASLLCGLRRGLVSAKHP